MSRSKKIPGTPSTDLDDTPDTPASKSDINLAAAATRRGRPRVTAPKELLTIRLDADIIASFKADGPGWQSRINAALRTFLGK